MSQIIQKIVNRRFYIHKLALLLCLTFYSTLAFALALPTNMSQTEGQELAFAFGMQSVHRMNGPANSIGIFPGIYPGVEFLMIFPPKVTDVGAHNGQITGFMPVPRIFITKGLPYNFDVNLHFLPAFVMPVYHGWGAFVKWTALTEQHFPVAVAAKLSYDRSSLISGGVGTSIFSLCGIVSQDLVNFIPYGGAGLIHSSQSVKPQFMATGQQLNYSKIALHAFAGVQIKAPLTFSLEIGFAGTSFYSGFSVGKNLFDETPRDATHVL